MLVHTCHTHFKSRLQVYVLSTSKVLAQQSEAAPRTALTMCCARQVPVDAAAEAAAAAGAQAEALQKEYGALETHITVKFVPQAGPAPDQALSEDSAAKLLTLLLTLPHGVLKHSHTVPGGGLFDENENPKNPRKNPHGMLKHSQPVPGGRDAGQTCTCSPAASAVSSMCSVVLLVHVTTLGKSRTSPGVCSQPCWPAHTYGGDNTV